MNFELSSKFYFLSKVFLVFLLLFIAVTEAIPRPLPREIILPEKPLVVLITSYNNKEYVRRNLTSVFAQKYSNYRIIYIDDCSTDNTSAMVQMLVERFNQQERLTFVRNDERVGALANIYHGVYSCRDEEIIVSLDGDDWFAHANVLKEINEAYTTSGCWLTHGSLIEYPNRSKAWSIPIPQEIIETNNFRSYRCPSHLRTFYAWLFKLIRLEDLLYDGNFFPMTWDQAMMFPMIEMAGERHQFIPEALYVYNVANSINDNKVNPQLQRDLEAYIRSMLPYQRLAKNPLE